LIASLIEQEWNQLYADHITDMAPMDDDINATFGGFSVDDLTNNIFYSSEGALGEDAHDRSLWKKVSSISLDELHNAKIDPTTTQPIEQNALLIRTNISSDIFRWWLGIVRGIIYEKMKKVYMQAGEISFPWERAADFNNIMKHINSKVVGSQYVQPHVKISNFNKADLLRYINKTVNFHNLVNKIYLSSAAHQSSSRRQVGRQAADEMTKLLAKSYAELGL